MDSSLSALVYSRHLTAQYPLFRNPEIMLIAGLTAAGGIAGVGVVIQICQRKRMEAAQIGRSGRLRRLCLGKLHCGRSAARRAMVDPLQWRFEWRNAA